MMKKILLSVLTALALVSCVRESIPVETPAEEGLVERTWTVSMTGEARATVDDGLRPVWEVGEELSVYDHVSRVGRIFTVASIDGNIATITGQIRRRHPLRRRLPGQKRRGLVDRRHRPLAAP